MVEQLIEYIQMKVIIENDKTFASPYHKYDVTKLIGKPVFVQLAFITEWLNEEAKMIESVTKRQPRSCLKG